MPFEFEHSPYYVHGAEAEELPEAEWATHIILVSKEDDATKRRCYKLHKECVERSSCLKDLLANETSEKQLVPVDVDAATLHYVVSWLENHLDPANTSQPIPKPLPQDLYTLGVLSEFDTRFLLTDLIVGGDEAQHGLLLTTLQAAHFLGIPQLLDLVSAGLGNIMRSKSVEEVRAIFHVEQDQSPEELERIEAGNRKYRELMDA